jgi:Family of unknown function (DUF6461)
MAGDGLGWLAREYADGFCLTFTRGLDEAACLARLGADGSAPVPGTRDDAARQDATWEGRYGPVARAGRAGEWAFTLETASFEGFRPEVLRRLSAGATTLCVFSDIEAVTGLGYAQDGAVLARHDDVLDVAELSLADLGWSLPEPAGLDLESAEDELGPAGPLLVLAETAFGLRMDPVVLEEEPLPSGRVIAVLPDIPAGDPEMGSYGARVDAAVAGAAPDVLRSALARQARAMTAEAALTGSGADGALDAIVAGEPLEVTDESALGRLVRELRWELRVAQHARLDADPRASAAAAAREDRRHRAEAADALRVAASRPPLAGLGAVVDVRARWGAPAWREELLAGLRMPPPAR